MDVLGSRWTLLIVRDLLCYDIRRFNELARGLPRMSRGLLSERLRQLQEAGIIERHAGNGTPAEYRLSKAGMELRPVVEALLRWGSKWTFEEPTSNELDPVLLMWWMRRRTRTEELPDQRVVAQFDFRRVDGSFWLVLDRSDVSVCLKRPKFDIDLWIEADLSVFYQVWLGRLEFDEAVRQGGVAVRSTPELERRFSSWFRWSPAVDLLAVTEHDPTSTSEALSRQQL